MRTRDGFIGGGLATEGTKHFGLIAGLSTIGHTKLIGPLIPLVTLVSTQAPHSELLVSHPHLLSDYLLILLSPQWPHLV